MSLEIITQAHTLFDTPQKWEAYIALKVQNEQIIKSWYQKMLSKANLYFSNNPVEGWGFHSWNPWDMRWHLNEFGNDSIELWYRSAVEFGIWFNPAFYDQAKVYKLLKDTRHSKIISAMESTNAGIYQGQYIASERGNFEFGSPHDRNFNWETLGWYAGNRSDEFVEQLARKVDRFRKNKEITDLLGELNRVSTKR